MKGKTNLGKVLLSVVIATAMLMPVTAFATYESTTNSNNGNNNDDDVTKLVDFKPTLPAPVGSVAPNADVYFYDDFTTFDTTVWSIENLAGDGNYSYNGTNGWMNWLYGTDNTDAENDYLNASVNLITLPTCVSAVILQFDYWGDGAVIWVEFDGNVLGSVTAAAPASQDYDITAYATPGIHTLTFHVNDTANRNFSIDNVTISANYTTDIIINGIENMVDGGRYNTFPKTIQVNVTNRGTENITDADFHLQIYREQPFDPETYHCWDLESCFLITWDTISADGDQATWYWTEKRSHSPTHSYACKPDYLSTYEANSEDYLVLHDWFTIPTEVDGKTVHAAYLNFSYWVQGEFDGTNAVDYGMIYIINATGTYAVGGPYYDSEGEWKYAEIDISAFIGQDIKIQFGWFSDDYLNYEGMYVDDICINLAFTSAQPLVFQGYVYTDLAANETRTITFPIDFDPEEGTYYIQVYSDYEDCIPDNHGLGHGYADEINYTIWFGDVCDAAVTDVTAPAEVLLHWDPSSTAGNYALVPINVTVYNNGTLTEDVPVKVSAKHALKDVMFKDDLEAGEDNWEQFDISGAGATNEWQLVDTLFYSPYHSWANVDPPDGTDRVIRTVDDFYTELTMENANIKTMVYYDLNPNVGAAPVLSTEGGVFVLGLYYSDTGLPYDVDALPFQGSSGGWTEFDWNEYIQTHTLYWEKNGYWGGFGELKDLKDLIEHIEARYGVHEFHPGFVTTADGGSGGVMAFDDFQIYRVYEGEEVWSTVYTVEDLEPGETASFEVVWNTTEYCDYVISAEVQLDCDQDPNNNKDSTVTRIYDELFTDVEAKECDDNTYGLPDHWHIVEECSICPTNHFWYNGEDETGNYITNTDEVLEINQVFNFTGVTEAYFNFTTKYWIESGWDYGYVEVSNDSGMHWFILDEYTGNTGGNWTDISIHLVPGVTELYSPYTDFEFLMPTTFFTENMHFRFRFYSDEYTTEKGWYIDDVNLTIHNATGWYTLFFDDMENGDANWIHMATYYNCHWHKESTFGNGSTAEWYWNGENKTWIGIGATLVNATYYDDTDPLPSWITITNNSAAWTDVYEWDKYLEIDAWGAAPDVWVNHSPVTLPNSPIIEIHYIGWAYAGLYGNTTFHYVEISNGTTTLVYNVTDVKSFYPDTPITLDISIFAGQTVNISFHFNGTYDDPYNYTVNVYQIADVEIWAYLPGPTIPDHEYYNNVDEKLVFEFDLTHAYEAILKWDQNYSFADSYPDDYGVVEISTDGGNTWKALLIVQGSSGGAWGHSEIDISEYAGGDVPVLVRFRFISNGANADYGWLIDNVGIEGKVDYIAPTVTATLDPATPDGNAGWYRSPVTITLTASDNVKVAAIYYRIDGGPWKTYTAPFTIDIDGEHTVDYYAVDEVGNPSETGTVSFKIDATAPSVQITYPQSGYIYLFGRELFKNPLGGTIIIGGITFKASADDATSGVDYVTFSIDGYTYEKATSPYEIWWHKFDFLPAKYTLTVSAYDEAGNKAADATLDFTHWL